MNDQWTRAVLAAALLAALPAVSPAQGLQQTSQAQSERPQARPPRPQPQQPQLDDADLFSPSQLLQSSPQRQPARPAQPAASGRAVSCSGAFAKDSNHLKLATMFDSKNVAFTEVDGPDGTKLMASVLFANDPKRRLEVLWENEAARSGTALIVINARSAWTAPKGLRLGQPLAAVEKLNGKPFKLSGFDKDNIASVADWQGGAMERIPGGCKIGVRLSLDPKAPEAARGEVTGDKELLSNDANLRAVRPTVAEIIVGY